MTRVLITGGAGFIGSSLASKLYNFDYDVLVVDDLSTGNQFNLERLSNLEFVKGDITNKAMLKRIFKQFQPEIVVHLAAIHFIPYCNNHPLRTLKANILGTKNLLECSRIERPDTIFFSSSAAVYAIGDEANTEESTVDPTDIYGITKVVGEGFVKLFQKETQTRLIVGRFFNVYGPGDPNPHVITEITRQINSGSQEIELGNISPKRDFIHVNDVADAIVVLLKKRKPVYDVFNIGTGKEYSIAEIVEICSRITGKNIVIRQTKERMRKCERMHLLADITKIKRFTAWSPKIKLREGLERFLVKYPIQTAGLLGIDY